MNNLIPLQADSSIQAQSEHLRLYAKDRIIGTSKAEYAGVIAYLFCAGDEE